MQNKLPMKGSAELTEREQEILRLIATGTSNKDIARQLFISSNTVKVHLRNIFVKIGVTSRTEAAVFALQAEFSKSVGIPVLEPDPQELLATSKVTIERKKPLIFWISILVMFLLVGVVTLVFIRYRTPKTAYASPTPVVTKRWQELAALPTARSGLAVAVYENQIFTIGGETGQGVTGVMERYNVETDKWTTLTSKPLPVTDINAAVIGGQIFIPGGRLTSGGETDILESYDPGQEKWERHAPLPVALSGYALVAFEGKLYVFGGWDGQNYVASVYTYDPTQDKWFERWPMPTPRGFAGAAEAGGNIYVVGGFNGHEALALNEEFQPEHDTWSRRASLPIRRYAFGMTSIADAIYVIGGEGGKNSSLTPLQYSPQKDQWQEFENPSSQTWSHLGLVPYQTRLYGVGGQSEGLPARRNLSYQAIYTILIPVIP